MTIHCGLRDLTSLPRNQTRSPCAGRAESYLLNHQGSPRPVLEFSRWALSNCQHSWASLVAQPVKNPPAMREPWVGKIPRRRARLPTPAFWPGEFLDCPWGGAGLTRLSGLHNLIMFLNIFSSPMGLKIYKLDFYDSGSSVNLNKTISKIFMPRYIRFVFIMVETILSCDFLYPKLSLTF